LVTKLSSGDLGFALADRIPRRISRIPLMLTILVWRRFLSRLGRVHMLIREGKLGSPSFPRASGPKNLVDGSHAAGQNAGKAVCFAGHGAVLMESRKEPFVRLVGTMRGWK